MLVFSRWKLLQKVSGVPAGDRPSTNSPKLITWCSYEYEDIPDVSCRSTAEFPRPWNFSAGRYIIKEGEAPPGRGLFFGAERGRTGHLTRVARTVVSVGCAIYSQLLRFEAELGWAGTYFCGSIPTWQRLYKIVHN